MTAQKKILVVDDEKQLVSLVKLHMDMAGHEVLTASDGERAIAIATEESPDLIILDLMLPKIDGWEVCRRLKADKRTFRVPVIMLTARTDTDDVLKGFECGADDYVTKPFSPRELVVRVKKLLDGTRNCSGAQKRRCPSGAETGLEDFRSRACPGY